MNVTDRRQTDRRTTTYSERERSLKIAYSKTQRETDNSRVDVYDKPT